MDHSEIELDESQISARELQKRLRKEVYEKQKMARKEKVRQEKEEERAAKEEKKQKNLAELWAAITPASELPDSEDESGNA